jgi:hypothetical protein
MTLQEKIELRDQLQREIDAEIAEGRAGVIADIRNTMAHFGITLRVIEESMRKRRRKRIDGVLQWV